MSFEENLNTLGQLARNQNTIDDFNEFAESMLTQNAEVLFNGPIADWDENMGRIKEIRALMQMQVNYLKEMSNEKD